MKDLITLINNQNGHGFTFDIFPKWFPNIPLLKVLCLPFIFIFAVIVILIGIVHEAIVRLFFGR